MNICVYTILTGKHYLTHVPLWIYSGVYNYNYHFKVFVDDDKDLFFLNDLLKEFNNWDIVVLPKQDFWHGIYSQMHRSIIEKEYFKNFDYILSMEGDIIFTSETLNKKYIEEAINIINVFDLPFFPNIRYKKSFLNDFYKYNEIDFVNYFKGRPTKEIRWNDTIINRFAMFGLFIKVDEYYRIYESLMDEYRYFKKTDEIDYYKDNVPKRYCVTNDEAWFYYFIMKNSNVANKLFEYYHYNVYKDEDEDLIKKLSQNNINFDKNKIISNRISFNDCSKLIHLGEFRGKTNTLIKKKNTYNWERRIKGFKKYNLDNFFEDKNVIFIINSFLTNKKSNLYSPEFNIFYNFYNTV